MTKQGPDFYDVESVFDTYSLHRSRAESPNETMEQPIIWELIGVTQNLDVLDSGCGEAQVAKKFKEQGARSYLGVEGSQRMSEKAKKNLDHGFSSVTSQWLEDYQPVASSVDLVISSLAFHYVENLDALLEKAFHALRPGGRIIFSTEHPVITSSNKSLENSAVRQAWIVDDYFQTGARTVRWMGDTVTKYHRSIEDFLKALKKSGFLLEELREANPAREYFADAALWERRRRIPLFLIISARKN